MSSRRKPRLLTFWARAECAVEFSIVRIQFSFSRSKHAKSTLQQTHLSRGSRDTDCCDPPFSPARYLFEAAFVQRGLIEFYITVQRIYIKSAPLSQLHMNFHSYISHLGRKCSSKIRIRPVLYANLHFCLCMWAGHA